MATGYNAGPTILQQLELLTPDEQIAYLLLQRYCENYNHVFGTPYWPGRDVLLGPHSGDALLATFVGIASYFRGRGLEIGDRAIPYQGYMRFAMEWYRELRDPATLTFLGLA